MCLYGLQLAKAVFDSIALWHGARTNTYTVPYFIYHIINIYITTPYIYWDMEYILYILETKYIYISVWYNLALAGRSELKKISSILLSPPKFLDSSVSLCICGIISLCLQHLYYNNVEMYIVLIVYSRL